MAKHTHPRHVTVYVRPDDWPVWKRAKKLILENKAHNLSTLVSDGLALMLAKIEGDPTIARLSATELQQAVRRLRSELDIVKAHVGVVVDDNGWVITDKRKW